jgi:predicted ATPase
MSDGDAPKKISLEPLIERAGFYGRSDELHDVTAAFQAGWRLVTLVGPPGAGKTRLAQRVAHEVERQNGAPVPVVMLGDCGTRDEAVAAVAAALGVSLASESGAGAQAVARALARSSQPLVVLDNLEQLVDHADLVAGWLDAAPRARVLVTSQTRLRLAGERVVEVGPLSIAAAVALFEERARAPLGRALSNDERLAAERVVQRVDCIPLAIELAAGRAAVLGVPALLERLERGLDVLRAQGPANRRHHSARAALSWSWDLLTPVEKRALAQASVFRGGFLLEAAEAVIDLSLHDVMDALQGLRERSLLWASRERGGALRFGLFSLVRDFAREKLDEKARGAAEKLGDALAVEARHAAAFARRGQDLVARVRAGDPDGLEVLLSDLANLEAAFERARDDEVRARLALALSLAFSRRGARAHHEDVLERGLVAARASGLLDVESDLLQARAALASAAGDVQLALACQERALVVAAALKDGSRAAFARARRGWDRFERGDESGGLADMRGAIDEAARAHDPSREAYARNRHGLALLSCGSATSGVDELARAAALASQTGDRWLRQKTLVELAHAHRRLGAVEAAAQRLLELAALGDPVDAPLAGASALEHAALARATGRASDALSILEDAIARADDAGALRARVVLRVERAAALVDVGRPGDALPVLDEALAVAARIQCTPYRALTLLEVGRARAALSDVDGARAAFDLAARALGDGDAGKDAITLSAIHVERALLLASAHDPRAAAAADEALAIAQRIGGKPLVVALCVGGLVDSSRVDERRASAEAILPRAQDAESRAAVAVLRGAGAPELALARRMAQVRGGRARRQMLVGADARFYEIDGQRVSMQRQRSLRLILLALIEHAERAPGVGLSRTEVLARGWPGEKMRPDSGATRVYTSIRRLRRGGLSGVLLTRDDGYLLDPSVAVRRVPTS